MRKLHMLLSIGIIFICTNIFMVSCKKDSDTVKELQIIANIIGEPTYFPGTEINFRIEIASNETLDELNVFPLDNGFSIIEPITLNGKSQTVNFTYWIPEEANPGEQIEVLFIARDQTTDKTSSIFYTVLGDLKISTSLNGAPSYIAGSNIGFNIKLASCKGLRGFDATMENSSITESHYFNGEYSADFNINFTIPTFAQPGDIITISFFAAEDFYTTTASYSFMVTENNINEKTKDAKIYHILGEQNGAWDLVEDKAVPESDVSQRYSAYNKDMVNIENINFGEFVHGWVAGNDTRFVIAKDFDYDNATLKTASTAFVQGIPIGDHEYTYNGNEAGIYDVSSSNPVLVETGDIVIAKLRNTHDYAVIKIEEIVDTGESDDDDFIRFTYKKANYKKKNGTSIPMSYR